MRIRPFAFGLAVVILVAVPRPAPAWGFEAHKYIMARVIPLLPREIRPFFEKHRTSIVEHVIDPDLWRTVGWEQESPRHFLDIDAYGSPPFADLPRDYDAAVAKYGLDFVTKNGTIPWRTAEIFAKLAEAFTQKAEYSRDNIKLFASVLTHYASDAHVPFHATSNHDGQLSGQWGIHSRFESQAFERYVRQLHVRSKAIQPVPAPRDFIFDTLIASLGLTAAVLDADKAAAEGRAMYDDEYFRQFFGRIRPILEQRLADSITGSASLITAAWIEAGRPALPLEPPRAPRPIRRATPVP